MSRDKLQLLSPLFLKYQSEYEKNPRSRVFAPLAETYRKLGMTEKAMEILAQGIRFHPTYVMGYLGLAFCYFDIRQFNLAYTTLRPLVESNRDNIRLQKLFADVCLELGQKEEALETYKYLLFINPRDKEVASQVSMLENLLENQYKPTHKPIYIPEEELVEKTSKAVSTDDSRLFDIDKLDSNPHPGQRDFDDWTALDLSRESVLEKDNDHYDFWNLKKAPEALVESPPEDESELVVKFDLDEEPRQSSIKQEAPLVTHTLVDLYCGQGHIEKALEVLEKILILNPNDQKTIDKIAEIKQLMGVDKTQEAPSSLAETAASGPEGLVMENPKVSAKNLLSLEDNLVSEEEGRLHLMSLIDETIGSDSPSGPENAIASQSQRMKAIEDKLVVFLQKIHKRALDYQSRV